MLRATPRHRTTLPLIIFILALGNIQLVVSVVCTDDEVALVVVDMDLSVGHSEQQDLTIGRPGYVGQLDPLQLLPPDPVTCRTST